MFESFGLDGYTGLAFLMVCRTRSWSGLVPVDQTVVTSLSSDSSISSSLLRDVRLLDPAAWRRLVDLFSPEVYEWARKAGLQPTDASDVLQEVFRAVVASIADFRRDRPNDSFRGWLWTIARNKIRDHFRKIGAVGAAAGGTDAQRFLESIPETLPTEESKAGAEPATRRVSRRLLNLIRDEFEKQTWDAFWRTAVDGVAAVEVARELGMSSGAVRQAKYRVLRRFREEIGELLD